MKKYIKNKVPSYISFSLGLQDHVWQIAERTTTNLSKVGAE
jgi:hypothetical protein